MSKKFIKPKVGMLWKVGESPGINRVNIIATGAIYFNQIGDGFCDKAYIIHICEWQKLIAAGIYELVDAEFIEAEIVSNEIEWEVGLSVNYPHFAGLLYVRIFAGAGALQDEITNKAKEQLAKEAYPVTYKRIS